MSDTIPGSQDSSWHQKVAVSQDRHIVGFDWLRVLAAFGVVWIHGSDTSTLARHMQTYTSFAVPSFIMMSFFLTQRSICQGGAMCAWLPLLRKKLTRLIPAYLAWSFLYILARSVKNVYLLQSGVEFDWLEVILFGGASYQLWFVPALIIWLAGFLPFMIRLSRSRRPELAGAAFFLIGVLIFIAAHFLKVFVDQSSFNIMFKYMIHQTGYVFWGIGIYLLWGELVRRKKYAVLFAVLAVILLVVGDLRGFSSVVVPVYAVATFLFFLVSSFPAKLVPITKIASVSFGIYLCHGLFVEAFQYIINNIGVRIDLFAVTALVILLAFVCSLFLCLLIKKSKYSELLVV